jgi:hypothetical protein
MFVVFGLVDLVGWLSVTGYAPPWYGYLFLLTAWLLNRSGRYTAAAALTLAMFPSVILVWVASGGSDHPVVSLAYLALGVQLAGILLPAPSRRASRSSRSCIATAWSGTARASVRR